MENLRKEFKEECSSDIKGTYSYMTCDEITDWWLSKLQDLKKEMEVNAEFGDIADSYCKVIKLVKALELLEKRIK